MIFASFHLFFTSEISFELVLNCPLFLAPFTSIQFIYKSNSFSPKNLTPQTQVESGHFGPYSSYETYYMQAGLQAWCQAVTC